MNSESHYEIKISVSLLDGSTNLGDIILRWCYENLGVPGSDQRWNWAVERRMCHIVFKESADYNQFINSEVYLWFLLIQ